MKVLFLVSRFPWPLEKGDKLRAYQHILNMHKSGHEVHLVTLSDCRVDEESISKVKPFCASLHILRLNLLRIFVNLVFAFIRKLPVQVGYFYSESHERKIHSIINEIKPDVIYCQLIRTALFVKKIPHIPKIIDYQDAFSKGTEQRMLKANFLLKPIFTREYKLVKKFENTTYDWFNSHVIISQQDLNSMEFSESKKVIVLPNGIDTNFFHPGSSAPLFDITFVGNMNYPPNVDAAVFLIKNIMPLVWKAIPKAKVQLAGANPSMQVKDLASEKVKVTGWVDDIRDCYKNTSVFIAPMRIGTGLQNKLLEAMAMQVACVTTPISFEPLGAARGADILVGSDAEELAAHMVRLLTHREIRNEIAANGHRFVVKNYSMEKSAALLDQVITSSASSVR